jgi:hypothetical protein
MKIATNPIYTKCQKVIDSCQTREQCRTAGKYVHLAHNKLNSQYMPKDFKKRVDYHLDVILPLIRVLYFRLQEKSVLMTE